MYSDRTIIIKQIFENYLNLNIPRFEEVINKTGKKNVLIYGVGRAGKQIFYYLKNKGFNISAFIDKNAQEKSFFNNIPIYSPDEAILKISKDEIEKCFALIGISQINHRNYSDIISLFKKLGVDGPIGNYFQYYVQYCNPNDISFGMVNNDYYSQNYQDICTVGDLLSDERSFEIYLKFISAYLSMDAFKFSSEEDHCQYFPNDISLKSGYSRFIDCGAYNGDTFLELIRQQKQVEYYIAYEPDLNSFEKLKNAIIKSGFHNPCILFPCGVSSKNCIQYLCLNGSSSNFSNSGDTITQSFTIDDTILNVFPTFIKMDVEGAEYDAILGAKKIIHNNKPDLAICVYHRADDIWRIPLLLKKIVPEYRFYLRTYTSYGLETVLYAVT